MHQKKSSGFLAPGQLAPERRHYRNNSLEETRFLVLNLCREKQPSWKVANALGSYCGSMQEKNRLVINGLIEEGLLTRIVVRSGLFAKVHWHQTTEQGLAHLREEEPQLVVQYADELKKLENPPAKLKMSRCRCGTFKKFDVSICKKCYRRAEKLAQMVISEFVA